MRITVVSSLIAVAALFLACAEDESPVIPGGNHYENPTRESVLNNLELAYNERVIAQMDSLLDSDFTFYFSLGDVGGNIPSQWGRADETAVTVMLFDPSLNAPPYPTCRSIRVDLKFENGVTWTDTVPPAFPTETWYETTVYYEFTFEFDPDQTYIAVGSQAQFTVRNVGTDNAPKWRLVEWRDLGSGSLALLSCTCATTWGGVKALYK